VGIYDDDDYYDDPSRDAPCVDARAPVRDAPPKSAIDDDACLREFLRELRAQRNAAIARDSMLGLAAAGVLAVTFAWSSGEKTKDDVSLRAEEPVLSLSAPATSTTARAPTPAPTVDGALPIEDVEKAIRADRREIERCLAPAKGAASAPGTVTIAFLVSERGSVLGVADAGSTDPDRSKIRCVAQRMQTLTLPPPKSGRVVVRYSF
jgi:hypothetical protein